MLKEFANRNFIPSLTEVPTLLEAPIPPHQTTKLTVLGSAQPLGGGMVCEFRSYSRNAIPPCWFLVLVPDCGGMTRSGSIADSY